jgi:hypothetical protein
MSDSSSTSSSEAARLVAKLVAFVAGLAVLFAGVGRFDRLSDVDVVGDKLAWLEAHRDEYDVVFVGSSYVYRQLSPATFDAETARLGRATRSFNFGIPGMDPPESYFLVERVLAASGGRLRYVVLELDYYRELVRQNGAHTRRFDYFHDAKRTAQLGRALVESPAPPSKRAKDVATHVEAFAREFLHVGRGRALATDLVAPASGDDLASLGPRHDGFLSLDDDTSTRGEWRRAFAGDLDEQLYAEKVAALAGGAEDERWSMSQVDVDALADTIATIRAAGATPILIVPPCLAARADILRAAHANFDVTILAFNSPAAYPALYAIESRFDAGHLNARGAAELSRALAEAFAAAQ